MRQRSSVDSGDRALIQIIDSAVAEAARRSGNWLLCRPGCTQCCLGPFAITPLDARRLRRGLAELEAEDPARAARVVGRARAAVERIPEGTPVEEIPGDDPCPALDPATGRCDLYASRPITCRSFGPPVRCAEEELGICDLCYEGATEAEIAACEVEIDPDNLEAGLLEALGNPGAETTVAQALATVARPA